MKKKIVIFILFVWVILLISISCTVMKPKDEQISRPTIHVTPVERAIDGLKEAKPRSVMTPKEGELIQLSMEIIQKDIKWNTLRMFGYNGEIPGPLIKVRQGQTIWLNLTNNIDMESTLHSHGLRLENEFDGMPGVTQDPIYPGESFLYKLYFPDPGMYWYHPHIREDYQQELGMYGNYWVVPENDEQNPVNGEEVLMLDDILIKGEDVPDFTEGEVNHALMGRFGNFMLVNGDAEPYELEVKKGEVVRFYFTNVANVRPFKLFFTNARMKLVGSDLGHYERDEFIDNLIIAPAERYIVEVQFNQEGVSTFKHSSHHGTYILGRIKVLPDPIEEDYSKEFESIKEYSVGEELRQYDGFINKEPDIEWKLTIDIEGIDRMMHADEDDLEYEDLMPFITPLTTNNTMEWQIVDVKTGKKNMEMMYNFKLGDLVKIRMENDINSVHPMQHPIHFHGQRFLVLEEDGNATENLVWKDTVLIPVGHTVDILLEITNPGMWMAHCHIAEHLQSGMVTMFHVQDDGEERQGHLFDFAK